MAKKKIKKKQVSEPKPKEVESNKPKKDVCLADDPIIEALVRNLQEMSDRIDRIVEAISKSKSVKGL